MTIEEKLAGKFTALPIGRQRKMLENEKMG